MTEEELARLARLVVQNVIRLENIARDIARQTTPAVKEIYRQLIQQIQGLPTGSVEREMAYQILEDVQRTIFRTPTIELASEIKGQLSAEAANQIKWAANYVQLDAGLIQPGVMAQMAVAAVDDVQVLNQAVEDITGPLTRSQWKRIDKTIRTGFLTGATNEQLARAVARTYKANLAERRAITRTAVMSLAQEAHNQFWDANDDVIVAWRWDASMDYRVCPVCAPLDGVEHVKRNMFKQMPPIHPNCRCHVVPVTEAMRETEQEDGEGDRSVVMLVPREGTDDYSKFQGNLKNAKEVRYYKSPVYVTVNGKRQKRQRVALTYAEKKKEALSMAQFISQSTTETQAQIFGSRKRALEYQRLLKRKDRHGNLLGPERALVDATRK
jgi:SPP1 gp7 family putative phage head morphogenesis protein